MDSLRPSIEPTNIYKSVSSQNLRAPNSSSIEDGDQSESVCRNQFSGTKIGVFTSGGDSQGMNATLRSVVRMGIYLGCQVYLIHEGFKGLVGGKHHFQLATWDYVSGIINVGGTIIGSARCVEFKEKQVRLRAAKNLIDHEINNLVCLGGDGTLTGANVFKNEWNALTQELFDKNEITEKQKDTYSYLNIVGIVCSIDNDFCGTDMTIGANSALHRIVESIDSISTTALSHQRCFVLEVMGRKSGYLALSAGLASEADWVFIPENPPIENWENILCKRLSYFRKSGNRLNIVIVAEGAIDIHGKPISSQYVKEVIESRLNIDTRITVLGHVQRGGNASCYDRVLGTRMGSEAVLKLLTSSPNSAAVVLAVKGNQTCFIPLVESVEKTKLVSNAVEAKDFAAAVQLRGNNFERNLHLYLKMSKMVQSIAVKAPHCTLAVLNLGSPSAGVNSAIRSFTRHGIAKGCRILAVHDGFGGLVKGCVEQLGWCSVYGWTSIGGSLLGCQKINAKQVGLARIAAKLRELRVDGLLLVGGFDAFLSVLQMSDARADHAEFCIPLICVPATISNNMPGSDFSLGCDTALNEIVLACDKIKQSAMGSKRRVFLIETMGGYCGYLASLAGLASGADHSYIFEERCTINNLIEDVRHLRNKMEGYLTRGLLVRNEMANENYTSAFLLSLLKEEAKDVFTTRLNVLGHVQQGGLPSPFDRNLGIKFGAMSLHHMLEAVEKKKTHQPAVVIGMQQSRILFSDVKELEKVSDFEHRLPKYQWWLKLRPLGRILCKNEAVYKSEIRLTLPQTTKKVASDPISVPERVALFDI